MGENHQTTAHALGDYLKRMRDERGLKQVEFAEKIEMSQRWVSDVERGKILTPRVTTLQRIAEVLNIPVESLVVLTGLADSRRGAEEVLARAIDAEDAQARKKNVDDLRAEAIALIPKLKPDDLEWMVVTLRRFAGHRK